jgi:hypothetical protein
MGPGALARGAALLLLVSAVLAQDNTRMRIQILPEDGVSDESASDVLGRLQDAVAVGDDGTSDVDAFSLLSDIQPETLTATMSKDKDHAAVDVYSESAFNAVANDDFKVTAGGKFEGRVQDTADLIVGGLDLQSLKKVSLTGGDHADLSVHGDIGTSATGAVSLDAATLTTHVTADTGLTAGGDLDLTAGGHASLGAKSLLAQVRGDIDATGAALKLSGTKELSVVAEDIDVQTPGAVKIAGKGGVAELGGESTMEYVGYKWSSNANFDSFENVLPETVNDVTEIVVRAGYAGSAAEFIATVPTTITIEVGTADGTGTVTYTKAWSSAVGIGTFSLDGLVVSMATPVDVSTIKLTASNGAGTFSGWTEVDFKLGVETAGGMLVASAGDIEATAAKSVLLNAESVSLSSSTDLDVSASTSARLASKDVSVLASETLAAAALDLSVQVSDTIEAFSGGDATASFGSVDAESRGPASLTAAGAVSVAAEAATVAVSGDLDATADSVKLNTESLETMTAHLTATVAEAASIYTTDASLSASGTLSAYMGAGDITAEGSLNMQSAGDVGVRTQGAVLLESMDSTTLRSGSLSTTTGSLQVRAGGGADTTTANVELVCEGDCQEAQFRAEMAELLGVPVSRLRVTAEDVETDSAGRRRMQDEEAPRTGKQARKTGRALHLWSVKELEKYVASVLGLPGLAAEIEGQRVDGAMAVEMSKAEWKEMGATGLEAARIVSALKKFAGEARSR